MIVFFNRLSYEQSRQQREHIRLQSRNQKLQYAHEQHERSRDRRHGNRPENEDQGNKAQNDDVACRDVREQTDHQSKRFCQDSDNLHRDHDRIKRFRHRRRENVSPVILVPAERCHDERDKRHDEREENASCQIRAEREKRDQSDKVIHPDKEEHGKQIRHIPLVFLDADVRDRNIIADESHQRLEETCEAFWRKLIFLV